MENESVPGLETNESAPEKRGKASKASLPERKVTDASPKIDDEEGRPTLRSINFDNTPEDTKRTMDSGQSKKVHQIQKYLDNDTFSSIQVHHEISPQASYNALDHD